MIISAAEIGPMIAGLALPDVNTRAGGSACGATEFTSETGRDTPGKSHRWTKIKRRAAKVRQHLDRATRPASLRLRPKRREGQAMQKPMAPLYAMHGRPAATSGCQAVTILPAPVVA